MASRATRLRRVRVRPGVVVAAAVLVLVAAAGVAHAMAGSAAPHYRLALVTRGSAAEHLTAVGTVQAAQQAVLSFPVGGTVSEVDAQVGQTVTAGQVLARLDPTGLQAQLAQSQSSLSSAHARLVSDTNAQSAASSATSAASASSRSSTSQAVTALGPQQQRLLADQQKADAALAKAKDLLAAATKACAEPTPTTSPSSTSSSSTSPTSDPIPNPCTAAQQAVLDAETSVVAAQQSVQQDESALDHPPQAAMTTAKTGGTVTAAQLAADQAAVDATTAEVAAAQQSLDQATLLSPVTGTVVAVNLAVADSVPAGSSSQTIVVDSPGSYQLTVPVPVVSIGSVAVGQRATVTPDGGQALSGSVASIGLLPTTGSTPATYPVIIEVPNGDGLRDGAPAVASIAIGASGGNVLTVPTSAVATLGRRHVVQVYSAGTVRSAVVGIGAVGPTFTEITSGLQVGQQVVLADLTAPVPSSTTSNLRLRGGFGPARG